MPVNFIPQSSSTDSILISAAKYCAGTDIDTGDSLSLPSARKTSRDPDARIPTVETSKRNRIIRFIESEVLQRTPSSLNLRSFQSIPPMELLIVLVFGDKEDKFFAGGKSSFESS